MTDDRKGGIALITGSVALLVIMTLHPSGHDLLAAADQFAFQAFLTAAVHTLGLAAMPVLFLGALALSRRLAAPDRLAVAALVVYGFALVAGMAAAAVSFLAPDLTREAVTAAAPAAEQSRLRFQCTGHRIQAFAKLYTVASSMAILLWSTAILKSKSLAPVLAIYGLLLGAVIILAVLSGNRRPGVHGFGLVVLSQAVWFILIGAVLLRQQDDALEPALPLGRRRTDLAVSFTEKTCPTSVTRNEERRNGRISCQAVLAQLTFGVACDMLWPQTDNNQHGVLDVRRPSRP
ncbi:MAG TPA: hypothetical protein VHR45_19835 [Thermoanaerobaculia bacterium]|nr:hypothetical protein [Thermoanaerobaculia bacterium]